MTRAITLFIFLALPTFLVAQNAISVKGETQQSVIPNQYFGEEKSELELLKSRYQTYTSQSQKDATSCMTTANEELLWEGGVSPSPSSSPQPEPQSYDYSLLNIPASTATTASTQPTLYARSAPKEKDTAWEQKLKRSIKKGK